MKAVKKLLSISLAVALAAGTFGMNTQGAFAADADPPFVYEIEDREGAEPGGGTDEPEAEEPDIVEEGETDEPAPIVMAAGDIAAFADSLATNLSELQSALANETVTSIEIPTGATVTLTGNDKVTIPAGKTLTVSGSLIIQTTGDSITGSKGFCAVTIETGGSLVVEAGGELRASNSNNSYVNSGVYNKGIMRLADGGSLRIDCQGRYSRGVTVSEGGLLELSGAVDIKIPYKNDIVNYGIFLYGTYGNQPTLRVMDGEINIENTGGVGIHTTPYANPVEIYDGVINVRNSSLEQNASLTKGIELNVDTYFHGGVINIEHEGYVNERYGPLFADPNRAFGIWNRGSQFVMNGGKLDIADPRPEAQSFLNDGQLILIEDMVGPESGPAPAIDADRVIHKGSGLLLYGTELKVLDGSSETEITGFSAYISRPGFSGTIAPVTVGSETWYPLNAGLNLSISAGGFPSYYEKPLTEDAFSRSKTIKAVYLYANDSMRPAIDVTYSGLADLKTGQAAGATITYTLRNAVFAASLSPGDFMISGLPAGLAVSSVNRTGDTEAKLTISGAPTKYYPRESELKLHSVPASAIEGPAPDIRPAGSVFAGPVEKGDGYYVEPVSGESSTTVTGLADLKTALNNSAIKTVTVPADTSISLNGDEAFAIPFGKTVTLADNSMLVIPRGETLAVFGELDIETTGDVITGSIGHIAVTNDGALVVGSGGSIRAHNSNEQGYTNNGIYNTGYMKVEGGGSLLIDCQSRLSRGVTVSDGGVLDLAGSVDIRIPYAGGIVNYGILLSGTYGNQPTLRVTGGVINIENKGGTGIHTTSYSNPIELRGGVINVCNDSTAGSTSLTKGIELSVDTYFYDGVINIDNKGDNQLNDNQNPTGNNNTFGIWNRDYSQFVMAGGIVKFSNKDPDLLGFFNDGYLARVVLIEDVVGGEPAIEKELIYHRRGLLLYGTKLRIEDESTGNIIPNSDISLLRPGIAGKINPVFVGGNLWYPLGEGVMLRVYAKGYIDYPYEELLLEYTEAKTEKIIALTPVGAISAYATATGLDDLKVGVEVENAGIVYSLTGGGVFMSSPNQNSFIVSALPPGLKAEQFVRTSDTEIVVPLSGKPTTATAERQNISLREVLYGSTVVGVSQNIDIIGSIEAGPVAKGVGVAISEDSLMRGTATNEVILADPVKKAEENEQLVEYALSMTNALPPENGWQTNRLFDGLQSGTAYYIWARARANASYDTGEARCGAAVATPASYSGPPIPPAPDAEATNLGELITAMADPALTTVEIPAGAAIELTGNDTVTIPDGKTLTVFGSVMIRDTASLPASEIRVVKNEGSLIIDSGGLITAKNKNRSSGIYNTGFMHVRDGGNLLIECQSTNAHGVNITDGGVLELAGNVDIRTPNNGGTPNFGIYLNGSAVFPTLRITGGTVNIDNKGGTGIHALAYSNPVEISGGTINVRNDSFTQNSNSSIGIDLYVDTLFTGGTINIENKGNNTTNQVINRSHGIFLSSSSWFIMAGGKVNIPNHDPALYGYGVYVQGTGCGIAVIDDKVEEENAIDPTRVYNVFSTDLSVYYGTYLEVLDADTGSSVTNFQATVKTSSTSSGKELKTITIDGETFYLMNGYPVSPTFVLTVTAPGYSSYTETITENYTSSKEIKTVYLKSTRPAINITSTGLGNLQVGKPLGTAMITYTLTNGQYATVGNMNLANFAVSGLPPGLTAGAATRTNNTIVTVPITGTPTVASENAQTITLPASIPRANVPLATADIVPTGTVTVGPIQPATPTEKDELAGIRIAHMPTAVEYRKGESLDLSGMDIQAVYKSGSVSSLKNAETDPAPVPADYTVAIDGGTASLELTDTGVRTVTVNYTEDSVTKSASFFIRVNAKPAFEVMQPNPDAGMPGEPEYIPLARQISLNPVADGIALVSVAVGSEGEGASAVTTYAPVSVTWSSSDTKVARVSSAGVVTKVAPGIVTITAKAKNNSTPGVTKNQASPVTFTIKDTAPRLPAAAITVYTKAENGTGFTVVGTNTFREGDDYDGVALVSVIENKKTKPKNYTEAFRLTGSGTDRGLKVEAGASDSVPKGSYIVILRATHTAAVDPGENPGGFVGTEFALIANVVQGSPKAAVKMPALNTFWEGAEGTISITGKDLPPIADVVLEDSATVKKDGRVTDNFSVAFDDVTQICTITAKNKKDRAFTLNSGKKPAVKGVLVVSFEGYPGFTQSIGVTVNNKPAAPKLKLAPAAITLNKNLGLTAGFSFTGGTLAGADGLIIKRDTSASTKANAALDAATRTGDSSFTVALASSVKPSSKNTFQINLWLVNGGKDATSAILVKPKVNTVTSTSYKLSTAKVTLNSNNARQTQEVTMTPNTANTPIDSVIIDRPSGAIAQGIEVMWAGPGANSDKLIVSVPQGAKKGNYAFTVKPNGVTSKAPKLTVSVVATALTATVKADKGSKIDLVAGGHTKITYSPVIKNNTLPVTGVKLVPMTGKGNDGSTKFDVRLAENNKVELTAKKNSVFTKGASYKIRIEFSLGGIATVTTGNVTVKPAHSKVNIKPATTPVFQSRAGKPHSVFVDLTPAKPAGAKIASIGFKPETAKNIKAGKLLHNPNNAYWFEFAEVGGKQGVRIWIHDSALVKPGKATLTFAVLYEGHGAEKNGTLKPVDLKIPLTVLK